MRTFSLDMIPGGAQTAVACNQFEAGDVWVFALYYDGGRYEIPTGADVSITGTKPDGAAYKIAGTVVSNAVQIVVTDQITACAGRSIAEILVESEAGGTTLYSANFPLLVEPAAVQGEFSPSEIPSAVVDEDGNVYYSQSLDSTLTVAGAAADAKAVGDAIAAIDPGGGGGGGEGPSPYTSNPAPLGTASPGTASKYSRGDHVHPLPAVATTSAAGLMSAQDKGRLDDLYADYSSALAALG